MSSLRRIATLKIFQILRMGFQDCPAGIRNAANHPIPFQGVVEPALRPTRREACPDDLTINPLPLFIEQWKLAAGLTQATTQPVQMPVFRHGTGFNRGSHGKVRAEGWLV